VILLIEDDTVQALHFRTLLEEAGSMVLWAGDGETGLQMAEQQSPDLIVLDVQLPGMNGFQVCQRLKEMRQTADIPVVMLTRHDDPETTLLGIQSGAVDYIPKDAFADAVLLERIRRMGLTGKIEGPAAEQ